jgi:hypothetical protein
MNNTIKIFLFHRIVFLEKGKLKTTSKTSMTLFLGKASFKVSNDFFRENLGEQFELVSKAKSFQTALQKLQKTRPDQR